MIKTRFVILSLQRSGSTAFSFFLNSHPHVRCHSEVLLKSAGSADAINHFFENTYTSNEPPGDPPRGMAPTERAVMLKNYDRNALGHPNDAITTGLLSAFLGSLFYNSDHPQPWTSLDNAGTLLKNENFEQEKAVGFKLMYYELSNAFLNHWLTSEPVKIIHMVRENVLRILLSHWVAKKRNIWHTESRLDPVCIRIDPEAIIPMLGELSKMQQLMTERFPASKALRITYEEFCHSPESLGQKVSGFLGIDDEPMVLPRFERTTPMVASDIIENYDELATVLRGTQYEQYLYQ